LKISKRPAPNAGRLLLPQLVQWLLAFVAYPHRRLKADRYAASDRPVSQPVKSSPVQPAQRPEWSPSGSDSAVADIGLVEILSTVEETAYIWDIASDRIDWESNAQSVLGIRNMNGIETGVGYQQLIALEHVNRRTQAIGSPHNATGKAIPYRVQYRFMPQGRRREYSIWLEDHGSWWADADGRVVRARGVIRVINDRYKEEQKLLFRSEHDELTGQLNRIRLSEALDAAMTQAAASGQAAAFLIVAINNMAVINEAFGFDVGDEIITEVGHGLKARLRAGDSLGRYSSNKFGLVLTDCGPGAVRIAAERFMKGIREKPIQTTACQLSATISIGGVLVPSQANTVQAAANAALQALDMAKLKRHDCFHAFEPSPERESARRRNITIADDVIKALDDDRMHLALQPIVSTRTRQPVLYECLLRMARPDGTIVAAGEFIEVAEQLGLSRLIDRRTLELSIAFAKLHPLVHLSLNVSSLTCSDHEWMVALHRLTGGQRQITERLTVEITETTAIDDIDQSAAFVDTLKELGCRVAIDDFGAGYTSFKNLKHLAVDMVKIDGAFVRNLQADKADAIFINTMVQLARSFNMETVAEWVGDETTAQMLAEAGIDYLQGFHFGKPLLSTDIDSPFRIVA
jgi:diguanylate cyclase (GGDEF)-like protein